MKLANCAGKAPNQREDPEARDPWFPGKGHSQNPGKIECFPCPVRAECKDYRRRINASHGIWGGDIVRRDEEDEDD